MRIVRIKNNTIYEDIWVGQTIAPGEYYDVPEIEHDVWINDAKVFQDIANGNLLVNNGEKDFSNPTEAWKWLVGDTLPKSKLGNKLAIHSSTMPAKEGKEYYLVWTGAGDYMGSPPSIGDGELLQFSLEPGIPSKTIEVHFHPIFGDTYIHEGYAKWVGAGIGDCLTAKVVAEPTQLQTVANLDLIVTSDNWVKYSPSGPGTGTHGFAANPILIPRTKSMDGDWDYDPINGLRPNLSGTGLYKISNIEREVHKYINKIPLEGDSYGYVTLTSDETAFLPPGYFLRITAINNSNSSWVVSMFIEVYREQTNIP